jgi:hypothetical protein
MMRTWLLVGTFLLAPASGLTAQATAGDTTAPLMRQRIEARFREVAREEMGLTDEQADRAFAIQLQTIRRRQELELAHRDVSALLASQLRPGVAADPNVVTRAIDSIGALQLSQAKLFGEEQRQFAAFLTPVQRAQLYQLRARINARVSDVIREREDRAAGRRRMPRRP